MKQKMIFNFSFAKKNYLFCFMNDFFFLTKYWGFEMIFGHIDPKHVLVEIVCCQIESHLIFFVTYKDVLIFFRYAIIFRKWKMYGKEKYFVHLVVSFHNSQTCNNLVSTQFLMWQLLLDIFIFKTHKFHSSNDTQAFWIYRLFFIQLYAITCWKWNKVLIKHFLPKRFLHLVI